MRIPTKQWLLTLCFAALAGAQQAPTPAILPSFEVASIRPNHSSDPVDFRTEPGGRRFMVRNMPLKGLIQIAYQVRDFQITGAPAWISSECFDVEAYAENPATWSQMQVMAQSLLKLARHPVHFVIATIFLVISRTHDDLKRGDNSRH